MDSVDGREQEDSSTPQHDDNMAAHSSSHNIHNRNHTGEQSSSCDARDKASPKQVERTKQIGYEPADLTVHPPSELPRVGSFFDSIMSFFMRCLVL